MHQIDAQRFQFDNNSYTHQKKESYMAISEENKKFLEDLLQYYIEQADSYSQFAKEYSEFSNSNREIAFGVITGTVYSAFLQTYSNQQLEVKLDDIQQFHEFMRDNIEKITNALDKKKPQVRINPNKKKISYVRNNWI